VALVYVSPCLHLFPHPGTTATTDPVFVDGKPVSVVGRPQSFEPRYAFARVGMGARIHTLGIAALAHAAQEDIIVSAAHDQTGKLRKQGGGEERVEDITERVGTGASCRCLRRGKGNWLTAFYWMTRVSSRAQCYSLTSRASLFRFRNPRGCRFTALHFDSPRKVTSGIVRGARGGCGRRPTAVCMLCAPGAPALSEGARCLPACSRRSSTLATRLAG